MASQSRWARAPSSQVSAKSGHSPSAGKMSFIDAVWAWGHPLLGPMPFAASDPFWTLVWVELAESREKL